jgi:hypothetical protein
MLWRLSIFLQLWCFVFVYVSFLHVCGGLGDGEPPVDHRERRLKGDGSARTRSTSSTSPAKPHDLLWSVRPHGIRTVEERVRDWRPGAVAPMHVPVRVGADARAGASRSRPPSVQVLPHVPVRGAPAAWPAGLPHTLQSPISHRREGALGVVGVVVGGAREGAGGADLALGGAVVLLVLAVGSGCSARACPWAWYAAEVALGALLAGGLAELVGVGAPLAVRADGVRPGALEVALLAEAAPDATGGRRT